MSTNDAVLDRREPRKTLPSGGEHADERSSALTDKSIWTATSPVGPVNLPSQWPGRPVVHSNQARRQDGREQISARRGMNLLLNRGVRN
jgi:hypothetical protein